MLFSVFACFVSSMTGIQRKPQWLWMWYSDLRRVRNTDLYFSLYCKPLLYLFCVVVALQMASLVSTALSCPLSAGQPTVSVLF